MRKLLVILSFAICLAESNALAIKPFKTLDLSASAPKPSWCSGRWIVFPNAAVWIDDNNLAAWLITTCIPEDRQKSKSLSELVFVISGGKTEVLQGTETLSIARGPAGTVLVGRGGTVDLMKPNLQIEQSIECPGKRVCAVFPSPSGWEKSDFALCSAVGSSERSEFYKGIPAQLSEPGADLPTQGVAVPKDPYPNVAFEEGISISPYSRKAWRVGDHEVWYFDKVGTLTRSEVGRAPAPVSPERWTPKDGICSGEMSLVKPIRFLATCVGTHFYTDGDLDSIFGYSRIALFDVNSKQILTRIDGPAYTSATLSPDGRQIAVIHRERVAIRLRLYRVE